MIKARKLLRLVHNPGAGEGGQHTKKDLIDLLEASGFECEYSSSKKKPLKDIAPETELIAIAGGDGTIRQTIMQLLDKKLKHKRPIALLPCGTANNIATALDIAEDTAKNIASWSSAKLKKFDVGLVTGLTKNLYFIESFGFGLFPKLMINLKNKSREQVNRPEDEFKMALEELLELTRNYKPVEVTVELNEQVIEQKCILVEVMNISSLGPKLNLSKEADPGDGYFDVVLVSADQRELLEHYVRQKLAGEEPDFPIKPIRAKKLLISWNANDAHADDEVLEGFNSEKLTISLLEGLIEVITP